MKKKKTLETEKTGMHKFWSGFVKFSTMMGRLIILFIAIAATVIPVSYLTK
jgi:hypothetical protein